MSIVLTDAAGRPKPQNAQMRTKIVFWHDPIRDHILQGAPEMFDPPRGYSKIVCNHAMEAEVWSARLRAQDKREAQMTDYEREQIEGPMRQRLREEVLEKLRNPSPGGDARRKRLQVALLNQALKMLDEQEKHAKTIRESYLHLEAFEAGK